MFEGGCGDLGCEDCAAEWGRPVVVAGSLELHQGLYAAIREEFMSESSQIYIKEGDFIDVFDKDNPLQRIISVHITKEVLDFLKDGNYFSHEYPAKLTRYV